ncbi:MAG: signal peptidase I [Nitriliruptor sp.]
MADGDHPSTSSDATASEDVAAPGDRSAARPDRDRSSGSFLRELPVLLLVAFVLAFLLRTFVLQVFFIPSASMEPTLTVDDRMVVEKVSYRFREPERGEIVVFEGESDTVELETDAASDLVRGVGQFLGVVPASARDFVKRVIGLPGDEVRIDGGQVFVNGVPLDEDYKVEEDTDYGPVIVPDDRLFFLGDNRPNSSDSRRSLGFVARDNVVGRAVVILFPLDHFGLLTGVEYPDVPDADAPAPEADAVPDADEVGESVNSLGPLRREAN